MGKLLVRDIAKEHVLAVLQPIWRSKNETATRLRGRIEAVLSYAMQAGYRPEEMNPARWKGGLDKLLPAPSKVAPVVHHAALGFSAAPAFMTRLRGMEGSGARALEFAILTAARSGEVRGVTWGEIDVAGKVWIVPAERMKAAREHRVPLSPQAVDLLSTLPRNQGDEAGLVFPAVRGGTLSDATLSAVLRRMKVPVTVHGFRSTFRDWLAECTNYPNQLCEMALAHVIDDKAEAAYRRGDMLKRRAQMMTDWADYLDHTSRTAA
jgi:integrase